MECPQRGGDASQHSAKLTPRPKASNEDSGSCSAEVSVLTELRAETALKAKAESKSGADSACRRDYLRPPEVCVNVEELLPEEPGRY